MEAICVPPSLPPNNHWIQYCELTLYIAKASQLDNIRFVFVCKLKPPEHRRETKRSSPLPPASFYVESLLLHFSILV